MMRILIIAALTLLMTSQAFATDTPSLAPGSDPEMKQIFDADQADRSDAAAFLKPGTQERDARRREQTRKLLADGRLHTGQDFTEAAYVFQHGHGDDFLLAHTLAVIATKKSDPEGPSIAAKTLDRYLQSHGAKQIYGTQFFSSTMTGDWTDEPYDRDLISDVLRAELGVPDQATQKARLEKYRASAAKAPAAEPVAPTPATQPNHVTIACASHGIERVFVRDKWTIGACGDKAVMAREDTPSGPGLLFVMPDGAKVKVTRIGTGGDAAEIAVATAALSAMTPGQLSDLATQSKAGQ